MGVQVFSSTQGGAPAKSGTRGNLIAILDACLINGFGLVTLDSLSQTGGIATGSRSAGISFGYGDTILIAGAADPLWNGQFRVIAATGTTVTFMVNAAASATATGTITAKVAPLGWTSPFRDTHKAIYQRSDPEATATLLYVDEASGPDGRMAWVRMFDAALSIHHLSGPCPNYDLKAASGFVWWNSDQANATARPWRLIGDDRAFWFISSHNLSYPSSAQWYFFGDMVSLKTPDPYCAMLWAGNGISADYADGMNSPAELNSSWFNNRYVRGRANNESQDVLVYSLGHFLNNYTNMGANPNPISFPNPANNGLVLTPVKLVEQGFGIRGYLPGIYQSYHTGALAHLDRVVSTLNGTPREILALYANSVLSNYVVPIDVTGPWR